MLMDYNTHMNIQMTKFRGFTLIELIVTIAVISVLALTAGPELATFFTRNKLVTQTNYFVSSLNIARSEAAKRGLKVSVCISNTAQNACVANGSWEQGWIAFVDPNGNGTIDGGDIILNVNNEVSGNTTIRSTQHVNSITYLGDGSASAGTFRICDSEGAIRAKAINVMGSGLISQARDNDSDSIVDDYQGNSISCP